MSIQFKLPRCIREFNTAGVRQRRANRDRKILKRRCLVEGLEDRKLMTASLGFTAPFELTITADPRGSQISIADLDPANSAANPNDYLQIRDVSRDGTRAYMFHKSMIQKINFNGSSYADTFHAPTGYGFNYMPLFYAVDAGGGADQITTGFYADNIQGGSGNDVIHAGGGNDVVDGGSGRDRIWGDAGDDTLDGNSGYDDLYGGAGNDVLNGGSSPDLLMGGAGNDHLFGDSGNDFLYGESGEDGLYGGSGTDYLHGGSGADRFILRTNETGFTRHTFSENGGTKWYLLADRITDDTAEDVRMRFTNEGARTVSWGPGVLPSSTTYTAGSWTDNEIKVFDEAFGVIADTTANNALLYKASGDELEFFRLGNASNQYVAFNDNVGNTHYSNQSIMTAGVTDSDWATQVVFHELGHNWDTTQEADSLIRIWGPAVVTSFRNLSQWTKSAPSDPTNFVKSLDKQWWYRKGSQFVRGYSATNPLEDYATTFSRYFMQQAGRPFADAKDAATDKVSMINSWAAMVRGLGTAARPAGAGGTSGNPNAMSANSAAYSNSYVSSVKANGMSAEANDTIQSGVTASKKKLAKSASTKSYIDTRPILYDQVFANYKTRELDAEIDALAADWAEPLELSKLGRLHEAG